MVKKRQINDSSQGKRCKTEPLQHSRGIKLSLDFRSESKNVTVQPYTVKINANEINELEMAKSSGVNALLAGFAYFLSKTSHFTESDVPMPFSKLLI